VNHHQDSRCFYRNEWRTHEIETTDATGQCSRLNQQHQSIVVAGLEGGAIRCDAKMARAMDSETVRINHKTINYSCIFRS
jgi:hypothetical protein